MASPRHAWGLICVAVVVTATACNSKSAPYSLDDLVSDLAALGVEVEQRPQPGGGSIFFEAPANPLLVDGHEVLAYEYDDVAQRKAISDTILMRGWSVNHTPIEWVASPHYWLKGRLVVQYLGDDTAPIELLSSVLGREFRPPQ